MPSPPKATCLLLTYQQQDHVAETVQSALQQDCAPMQIVLSDDASRDDTFLRMKEVVDRYDGPHEVVLNRNETNLGVNEHLKKALGMCREDIIIAAAGDDLYYPHRNRRILEAFDATDPLLVFSHADVTTLDGAPAPALYRKATFYRTTDRMAAAKSLSLYLGATCAWHRSLYRKYGPMMFDNTFEDLILGFRAALEDRVHFIDEALLTYRVGSGLTNTKPERFTPDSYRAQRLREIESNTCVYRQRAADAKTFGLGPAHEVSKLLADRVADGEVRAAFIEKGWAGLAPFLGRHPLRAISRGVSEARRRKKRIGAT